MRNEECYEHYNNLLYNNKLVFKWLINSQKDCLVGKLGHYSICVS